MPRSTTPRPAPPRLEADERLWITLAIAVAPICLLGYGMFHVWRGEPTRPLHALAYLVVLGFTAFMAWIRLAGVRRGRPTLVIDHEGIDYARFLPIPWAVVRGISLAQSGTPSRPLHLLALLVEQPERFLGTQGWQSWQRRRLRGAARGELFLPLDSLDRPAADIHRAALDWRRQAGPGLEPAWRPESLPHRDD